MTDAKTDATTKASGGLPLIIFCGKGGVGKTTLALAYALQHAGAGRTALVVTSHPLAELAVSVSLAGLKEKSPQAAPRLFVIFVDPKEILAQTVKQQIPSAALAEAVVSSRIYQSLIEVAPGLKEMVFLHRLQQLVEQRAGDGASRKYDLVVWDAPATGHFLQTMDVSRHFNHYLSGPFARLGEEITVFFSKPENYAVIPVTTLEEMAVEETIELSTALAQKLGMRPRSVICNMASPLLAAAPGDGAAPDVFNRTQQGTADPTLQFVFDRLAVERLLYDQLRARTDARPFVVERRHRFGTDLDLLLDLAGRLTGAAGD
jgi:Mrp family chromosome partitioning ATPase